MEITLTNQQLIQKLKQWNTNTPIHTACRSGGGFNYTPVTKVDVAYPDKEMSATNPPIIHGTHQAAGLTVLQLIDELEKWPGDFPAFIQNSDPASDAPADYIPVQGVGLFDSSAESSDNNPLGIEAGDSSWLGGEDWATHPFPGEYLGS